MGRRGLLGEVMVRATALNGTSPSIDGYYYAAMPRKRSGVSNLEGFDMYIGGGLVGTIVIVLLVLFVMGRI